MKRHAKKLQREQRRRERLFDPLRPDAHASVICLSSAPAGFRLSAMSEIKSRLDAVKVAMRAQDKPRLTTLRLASRTSSASKSTNASRWMTPEPY